MFARFKGLWLTSWQWIIYQVKCLKWIIASLLVGLTTASVFFANKLTLESDLLALLPENTKSLVEFNKLKETLGGIGFYIIILESNSDSPEHNLLKSEASKLYQKLSNHNYIRENTKDIYYRFPLAFFRKYALLYAKIEDLRTIQARLEKKIDFEVRQANPYLVDIENKQVNFYLGDIARKYKKYNYNTDYFLDKKGRRLAIFIKPNKPATDITFNRKFYYNLFDILENHEFSKKIKYFVAGRYTIEPAQHELLSADIGKTSLLTLVTLLILMILFFRSLRAIFVIGLPLFIGLSSTLALTYLFIGRISLISAFLSSILLGLGIDYGVHLLSRYKEERMQGNGITQALVTTFASLGSSLGFGAFTTSVGFLSLIFSEFLAFAEFGFMAFMGILCCLIAFVLFFPTIVFITEHFEGRVIPNAKINTGKVKFIYLWVGVGLLLNAIGFLGIGNIRFEYEFSKLNATSEKIEQAQKKLDKVIKRQANPIVYTVSNLNDLQILHNRFQGSKYKDVIARSLLNFSPEKRSQKQMIISQMKTLLQRARFLMRDDEEKVKKVDRALYYTYTESFSINKVPKQVRRLFVKYDAKTKKKKYFFYLYPKEEVRKGKAILNFASNYRSICLDEGIDLSVCDDSRLIYGASDNIILSDILNLILKDIYLGAGIVSTIVFLVLLLLIRNLWGLIMVLFPLISGLLSLFASLYIISFFTDNILFQLNYINVVAFPILLGVGIDNGLHLYKRSKDRNFEDLNFVMSETGNAVFLSNFTTGVGFCSLIFASHAGLASLGIISVLGIGNIYMAYNYLFPVLARLFKKVKLNI